MSKGLMADSSYSSQANSGNCQYQASKVVAKITAVIYCSNYLKPGSCNPEIVNKMLLKDRLLS